MGETGCGKTRLIRFMCNLASQGSGQRNMLILKVRDNPFLIACTFGSTQCSGHVVYGPSSMAAI